MLKGKSLLVLIVLFVTAVLFSGCGAKDAATGGGDVIQEKNTVIIQNFNFIPPKIVIKKGETVKWVNKDANPHDVSGSGFGSQPIYIEQDFSHTFNETGTFDYFCSFHSEMKGQVVVE